jgi:Icc-related predicted phosphoesterase
MRAWIFSDIHLRIQEAAGLLRPFAIPEADVAVVAGDICDGVTGSLRWMGSVVRPHMRVVAVLGNHEFFGYDLTGARRDAAQMAGDLGIDLLDDTAREIDGVRFVGGTLWTDFKLFKDIGGPAEFDERACMYEAKRSFADYDEIWATEASDRRIARTLSPRDTVALHERTAAFLDQARQSAFSGSTVAVTHHAPYPRSVHQVFLDKATSAAYASDMGGLIEAWQPQMWVHGHTHMSFDYMVGETRIVCNPRGYAERENPSFRSSFLVDL